jgi:hypothetical protein
MNELEQQIRLARLALEEAERAEKEESYSDAMLSIERGYCEGFVDALEFVYNLQNGHGYEEK